MGKKRKARWGSRAKDFGDDPKYVGGQERKRRHSEEPWERVRVKTYRRKNPRGKGTHSVKAHSRKPPRKH